MGLVPARDDDSIDIVAGLLRRVDELERLGASRWGVLQWNLPWVSYTPTLTQSGAVAKTVNYAKSALIGKTCIVEGHMTCSGAGTAANPVTISLLTPAAFASSIITCGTGFIFDASASLIYHGNGILNSTTTFAMYPMTSTGATLLGANTFTAALAASDQVSYRAIYEVP